MLNRFREWYFKRCVLLCADDEEYLEAMRIIMAHNAKVLGEHNIFRWLLIKGMVPPVYKDVAFATIAVQGKNLSECIQITREFREATNGFIINKQDFVEI